MGWIIAIFLTMGAVGNTTGGQNAYTADAEFKCDFDTVYAPEERTLQLGKFECNVHATHTPGPSQEPTPTTSQQPGATPTPATEVLGIWTNAAELGAKNRSCTAWRAVAARADLVNQNPCIHSKDDPMPNRTLAKAIAFAHTGDAIYKEQVEAALAALVSRPVTECIPATDQDLLLAWSRNLGGYIMAADLVGYHNSAFTTYITHVATAWKADHPSGITNMTMVQMFDTTPDHASKWAAVSLAAYYRYIDDDVQLASLRLKLLNKLYGPVPQGVIDYIDTYGESDWYNYTAGVKHYQEIAAPATTTKQCLVNIGNNGDTFEMDHNGLQPSEMRDGGECSYNPEYTKNAWYGVEALVVAARIFERAGMPIWRDPGQLDGLFRAPYALEYRLGRDRENSGGERWMASAGTEDRTWMLAFLDEAYPHRGKKFADRIGDSELKKWGASKHSGGFGFVLPGVCQ